MGRRFRRIGAALITMVGLTVIVTLATGEVALVTTHGISMEPTFHTGDLAVLVPTPRYHVGEVVGYHSPLLHIVVLHRIVAEHAGRFTFKGDDNSFLDPVRLPAAAIEGRLWLHISGGGVVLGWFRSPLVLGFLAFLVVALGIGGATRRRRTRGQGGGPAAGSGPPRGAPGTVGVDAWPIAVALSVVALFGLVTMMSWTRPTTHPSVSPLSYNEHVSFSYTGAAPAGLTYPTGKVTTGDPVFLHLVDKLDVGFHYALTSHALGAKPVIKGTIGATATVQGPGGWTAPLTAVVPTAFSGSVATVDVPLDLTQIPALEKTFGFETGVPLIDPDIVVTPVVHVGGTMAGAPVRDTFAPTLTFSVEGQYLNVVSVSSGAGADAAHQMTLDRTGSVEHRILVPTRMALMGRSASVAGVRSFGLWGLILAILAAFGTWLWVVRRRRMDETSRIHAAYSHDLVGLSANPAPKAPLVVDVETFDELARLARRYDCMILEYAHLDGHAYYVESGTTLYRCGVSNSEPIPAPVDHVDCADDDRPALIDLAHVDHVDRDHVDRPALIDLAHLDHVDCAEVDQPALIDLAHLDHVGRDHVDQPTHVDELARVDLADADGIDQVDQIDHSFPIPAPVVASVGTEEPLVGAVRRGARKLRSIASPHDSDTARIGDDVDVLTLLAKAEWVSGVGDAGAHLREAVVLARKAGLDQPMVEALLVGVRTSFDAGQQSDPEKIEFLEYALTLPGDSPGRRAGLLGALAVESIFVEYSDPRGPVLDEAQELARRSGDPRALVAVAAADFWARPRSTWSGRRFALDRPLFGQALEAAQGLGDPAGLATAQAHAAFCAFMAGDSESLRTLTTALERTAAGGQNQVALRFHLLLSQALATLEGRLDVAEALSAEASDVREATGIAQSDAVGAIAQLALRREQDRMAELIPASTGDVTSRPPAGAAAAVEAFALVESGHRDDAAILLHRAGHAAFNDIPDDVDWPVAVALWSEVAARVGDRRAAAELVEILRPHDGIQMCSGGAGCGPASRLLAIQEMLLGRPAEADRHFAEAIAFSREFSSPVWTARCQLDWAQTWLDRGETVLAAQLTDAADDAAGELALPALGRQWTALRDQLDRA